MGAGLCAGDSGEQRAPTPPSSEARGAEGVASTPHADRVGKESPDAPVPLLCAECLKEGLPPSLAMIGEHETLYVNPDGEPCCSRCGFENSLTAMRGAFGCNPSS